MIPEGSKLDKNLALDRMDTLCRIESLILSLTERTHRAHTHIPTYIQDEEQVGVTHRRICKMISTQNIDLTLETKPEP